MNDRVEHAEGLDDLLARARAGSGAAENALFQRIHARIHSLAKRRLWDREAAQDIAQEVMLTVYEKYRDAQMPHGLFPWLFAILRNKVGNYLKRHRTSSRFVQRGVLEWDAIGVSPDEEVAGFHLSRLIEDALERLSPECRKVFGMLIEGADRNEIREAFGSEPMGTTDSRISRCRAKLLAFLEDQRPMRIRA